MSLLRNTKYSRVVSGNAHEEVVFMVSREMRKNWEKEASRRSTFTVVIRSDSNITQTRQATGDAHDDRTLRESSHFRHTSIVSQLIVLYILHSPIPFFNHPFTRLQG